MYILSYVHATEPQDPCAYSDAGLNEVGHLVPHRAFASPHNTLQSTANKDTAPKNNARPPPPSMFLAVALGAPVIEMPPREMAKRPDPPATPPRPRPTSFHLFPRLPQEIQDLIWAAAIPPRRQAHLVTLDRVIFFPDEPGSWSTITTRQRPWPVPQPREPTLAAAAALSLTSRAARAVAHRVAAPLRASLELLPPPLIPLPPDDVAPEPPAPRVLVGWEEDLAVLEYRWPRSALGARTTLRADPLRYAAFEPFKALTAGHEPGDEGWHVSRNAFSWLTNTYDLRVVYALLPPEYLRGYASETPFPDGEEVSELLDSFIGAYGSADVAPGPWTCGAREYYEVPAEEIRGMGGLWSIIVTLERVRLERVAAGAVDYEARGDKGTYSTRHRFMTWRDLPEEVKGGG